MDLAYITPLHVHCIEGGSLERSLHVYQEALAAIRHVSSPVVLELRMQLAQAIEQLQKELSLRSAGPAERLRPAA